MMNGYEMSKLTCSSSDLLTSSHFTSSSSSSSSCLSGSSSLSSSPKTATTTAGNGSNYCDQQIQLLQSSLLISLKNRLITANSMAMANGVKSSALSTEDFLDSSSISDDMDNSQPMNSQDAAGSTKSIGGGRANRFFPDNVVDILNQWVY